MAIWNLKKYMDEQKPHVVQTRLFLGNTIGRISAILAGVKVIVDRKSLIYLDGTELDYKREGLNEGFEFNNPNVKDACGCGESFTV